MASFHSAREKTRTMEFTKKLWDGLQVFEPLAEKNEHIDYLIKSMLWPSSTFVREGLVGAFENDFEKFSPQTEQDLEDAARAMGVKVIEDLHRNLNLKARQAMNDQCTRTTRWATGISCGVVQGNDRELATPSDQDYRDAKRIKLNHHSYETVNKNFSLGEAIFDDMLNQKETFITYTQGDTNKYEQFQIYLHMSLICKTLFDKHVRCYIFPQA
jgi:hypothetical protein